MWCTTRNHKESCLKSVEPGNKHEEFRAWPRNLNRVGRMGQDIAMSLKWTGADQNGIQTKPGSPCTPTIVAQGSGAEPCTTAQPMDCFRTAQHWAPQCRTELARDFTHHHKGLGLEVQYNGLGSGHVKQCWFWVGWAADALGLAVLSCGPACRTLVWRRKGSRATQL
ncbi:hypothetical protein ANN_06502 [Periplaneta americana]|uniref:Uncharacterized protein n=1 Tax=Periplaneta americana TaxID=6978 RepID=A0ABQ8TG85_PERAM|nr:hypothetical protein ANN_06502 [Periplaneta americana]